MEEDNRLISFYTAPAPPQQRLCSALHWARNVWADMEKVGDTGDISLLFFLAGAIFGPFWVIFWPFGHF